MIIEAIATGRTVDEAVATACEQLGKDSGDVEIEIIDLPKRGFLGLTHTPAKVRAYIEVKDAPVAPVKKEEPLKTETSVKREAPKQNVNMPREEKSAPPQKAKCVEVNKNLENHQEEEKAIPQDKKFTDDSDLGEEIPINPRGEAALNYVKTVVSLMNIENIEVTAVQYEKVIVVKINGVGAGAVIGRRGESLDALQYLTGLCANRSEGDYCRVVIDAGNYRQKRKQTLQQLATRLAANAIKSGRSVTLEPMNPYERRIIHATVSEIKGAVSTSVGEEPQRCVVISCEGAPNVRQRNFRQAPNKKPYPNDKRGGHRQGTGIKRDKPQPYKESSVRETAPSEATNSPLYGKIEI